MTNCINSQIMMTKTQKKFLLSLSHNDDPVVWIGQHGLTDNVMVEIEAALDHHELIKIKIRVGERKERDSVIDSICKQTSSEVIKRIGNVVTLFRRNSVEPKIKLPK